MESTVDSPLCQTVLVVDDDKIIRQQVTGLLARAGFAVQAFASADELLCQLDGAGGGCLLLDVDMPGMSGIELQREINARGIELPIVFLTGHGTIPMAVDALRAGAVTFLEKPVVGHALVEAVAQAFARDARQRRSAAEESTRQDLLARLTARELEVVRLIARGLSNKEIARELGISYRTVEIHRSHIMQKLAADSVVDLVQIAGPMER